MIYDMISIYEIVYWNSLKKLKTVDAEKLKMYVVLIRISYCIKFYNEMWNNFIINIHYA